MANGSMIKFLGLIVPFKIWLVVLSEWVILEKVLVWDKWVLLAFFLSNLIRF